MNDYGTWLIATLPTAVVLVLTLVALGGIRLWSNKRSKDRSGTEFRRQSFTIIVYLFALLAIVLVLPIDDEPRGQILSLVGVVLSAMIALSSTTVLGNALAGLMLRAQRTFRAGDFIEIEGHFGRVSERGLFHTEIQNEARDLTTFPNVYLAKQPMTVLHAPDTLVSATVSLGYEVPRGHIEKALLAAAGGAALKEPFVRVLELGDFSVTYRVSGLLDEAKRIVSVRSRLNSMVLDALHDAGLEIVSPAFMNQRVLAAEKSFIPPRVRREKDDLSGRVEKLMFDKAEAAETIENLEQLHEDLKERVEELEKRAAEASTPSEKERLEQQAQSLRDRRQWLKSVIVKRTEDKKS